MHGFAHATSLRVPPLCASLVSPRLRTPGYALRARGVPLACVDLGSHTPFVSELELRSDCVICDQPSFLQPVFFETSLLHIFYFKLNPFDVSPRHT